jgi:hypothetical protein
VKIEQGVEESGSAEVRTSKVLYLRGGLRKRQWPSGVRTVVHLEPVRFKLGDADGR